MKPILSTKVGLMHRYHLDIVDWVKVQTVAELVEARTMDSAELRFGPLVVSIYERRTSDPTTNIFCIEFQEKP